MGQTFDRERDSPLALLQVSVVFNTIKHDILLEGLEGVGDGWRGLMMVLPSPARQYPEGGCWEITDSLPGQ